MSEGAAETLENVELVEEEHIVPRGTKTIVWLVRVRDAWVMARDIDGAVTTKLDSPPGHVFRRRVELALARGTRLLRVETSPKLERRTPLDYLSRGKGASKSQRKLEFRVGRAGILRRSDGD